LVFRTLPRRIKITNLFEKGNPPVAVIKPIHYGCD
jgi:hypothetical protein